MIRPATPADREAVVQTVTEAFDGDPAWGFLLGEEYPRLAPLFAAVLFDVRVASGNVWVSGELGSVAMWESPDRSLYTGPEAKALWAEFEPAVGAGASARVIAYDDALAAVAPSDPHWYLGTLATAPAVQRSGLASAVIAPVLERADREGIACCLETSTEPNRRFYERRGFTEATDVEVSGGPPTWWLRRPAGSG